MINRINIKVLVNLISFIVCVAACIAIITIKRGNFIAPVTYLCLVYLPLTFIQGGFLISFFANRRNINKSQKINIIFPIVILLLAITSFIYFINTTT
jgi:hypothetical protein